MMAVERQITSPRLLCTEPSALISSQLSKNQLKDVIKDKVASSTVREKLEGLTIVHGSLLLVDLHMFPVSF